MTTSKKTKTEAVTDSKTIATLLIANRSEIALRIIRAAREMGITTVAIYSEDDSQALHTQAADQAFALNGTGAAAYLDIDPIIALAQAQGVDAIHPGYGFLSENSQFAQRCEQAGITFIGPSAHQLDLFGDKVKARKVAEQSQVPCIEGSNRATSLAEATDFFQSLGTNPAIMIKAIAGGGGRGMRAVHSLDELPAAYQRCQSEANAAFGNSEVYVERLIQQPRHIEIQIIGDGSGAVSHLWERECSIQRRHQKVVEIAPSPNLNPSLRQRLTEAAVHIGEQVNYRGLGTVEFLVDGIDTDQFYFIEVNPRIQVEHTVTEEVLRLDLVQAQIGIAQGQTLAQLGLSQNAIGQPRGHAIQLRINMETINPDGSTTPASGTLQRFELPSGPGIRVDTAAYSGYSPSPYFDSLLAKIIVYSTSADYTQAVTRAYQALCELRIEGVATNVPFLQNLLSLPAFRDNAINTGFIDQHLASLTAAQTRHRQGYIATASHSGNQANSETTPLTDAPGLEAGQVALASPLQGLVVELIVTQGDTVKRGQPMAVVEAMKMEHVINAEHSGQVHSILVSQGQALQAGQCLMVVTTDTSGETQTHQTEAIDLDHIRPDLKDLLQRQQLLQDSARPEAVNKRHQQGQQTARENLLQLVDPGSFLEYGGFAIAAQRNRRNLEELIKNTPADGMVAGVAHVNGEHFDDQQSRCLVMAYDSTVHAGTQGMMAHKKKDRLLDLAAEQALPIILFAEGGGGRPGDNDVTLIVESPSFLKYAQLSGRVPLIGITTRYCFAGNAALLGCSDVIIATENACIGMAGPAMVEGGGLGSYHPSEIGPISVQAPNGVVDIVVKNEAEAVAVTKRYLSYFQGPMKQWASNDQRPLRHSIPENRSRTYDIHALINTLADTDSVLELRRDYAQGMVTALIRIEGKAFGVIANNSSHNGGAIESPSADKAARFMRLCNAFDIPLINLMDTPGFMVGPEAEKTAQVRRFSRMFVAAAACSVPIFTVVLRKGYGLGALSMTSGSFHSAVFSVAWPTAEFGTMGLEGAVRLGHSKELAAIENPQERQALFDQLLAKLQALGKPMNMASHLEIDNVIDPIDTREWLLKGLSVAAKRKKGPDETRFIDTW